MIGQKRHSIVSEKLDQTHSILKIDSIDSSEFSVNAPRAKTHQTVTQFDIFLNYLDELKNTYQIRADVTPEDRAERFPRVNKVFLHSHTKGPRVLLCVNKY